MELKSKNAKMMKRQKEIRGYLLTRVQQMKGTEAEIKDEDLELR